MTNIINWMKTSFTNMYEILKRNIKIEAVMAFLLLMSITMIACNMEKIVESDNKETKKQEHKPFSGYTIVIDPGHGGIDPGKIGINDALEKNINLSISLYIEEILKSTGAKVVLTRESDTGLYQESDGNKKRADMENRFVVPGKTLAEIAKLLSDEPAGEGEPEKTASIQVSRQYILTTIGSYSLVSRLLDGEFLDYQAAIPQGYTTQVTVSTRELIAAVDRASLIISDRLRSPLRLRFEEDSLRITCTTSLGKAYDEVPCHIEGNALEMGFNNKYVLDALRAADCDEICLQISGPLSPMKLVPPEGDSFLFLVLPVRLKTEQ